MSAGETGAQPDARSDELTAVGVPIPDPAEHEYAPGTEPDPKVGELLTTDSVPVAAADDRPESNRALSLMSARGFRTKMLRWRRQLGQINAMESTLAAEDDVTLRSLDGDQEYWPEMDSLGRFRMAAAPGRYRLMYGAIAGPTVEVQPRETTRAEFRVR